MKIGNIDINLTGNSGVIIEAEGKIIYIDPYHLQQTHKKADIILITHPHYDHCSVQDIEAISKNGTTIVLPPDCQSKITKIKQEVEMQIVELGDEIEIKGIKISVVPAYNLNKSFHPKNENWHGYVVKINGQEIYHAGDTDLIPEMKKLSGYHNLIAFFPVGGKFTMDAEQAAEAASVIKPELAIPIHYASVSGSIEDADRFVELCEEKGIEAKRLE